MSALNKFVTTAVPQTEQARPDQVKNNAGEFVFKTSDVARLERFLILGTDGGTYYVGERDLTKANVDFIRKMIATDPKTVLSTVVDVSVQGRAYRNEAAIFVLALVLSEPEAVQGVKQAAVEAVPYVARIATHVFQLATFIEGLGGWGRAKRRAIAKWFESKTPEQLAYQAVKYRQRNGWTQRDLMRLAHPKGIDQRVGNFILKGDTPVVTGLESGTYAILVGFAEMQKATTVKQVLSTLRAFPNLPWEAIPTQFLKDPEVWKVLFANGQLKGQALVRQITRLSRIGAFNDMVFAREVADKLVDSDMIEKTRLHPIQYLLASVTHREGQLQRDGYGWGFSSQRKRDWDIVPVIADALDEGFHKSFKSVVPANKRTLLGLDVSGSMGQNALGIDLSCAQVAGAMAMVTARVEPYTMVRGFATDFRDLGITPKQDFGTIMRKISNQNFGGTDCALPMTWALQNKVEVDTFQIYTDNETWAGRVHPHKALEVYRQRMGIDAKLAVVGVASTEFSIADPRDPGQMDFVGFDSNAPRVMADFSAGRL
jgi:60 kDa SS-A/Ro ribonucleoprotein